MPFFKNKGRGWHRHNERISSALLCGQTYHLKKQWRHEIHRADHQSIDYEDDHA